MYIDGLVSVVIPTYRRSDMLDRAINSVRKQTYANLEILVVNDNVEGDEFSQIVNEKIKKYKNDKRVELVNQEKHINGAAARNAGIRRAQGEYLAFLDDDDWWEPDKIEKQINVLKKLPEEWGGVGCLMRRYKKGKLVFASLPYKEGYIMHEVMQRRIGIGTGSLLMRRKAVDECGYFDESLRRHQDVQFFAFLTSKYKVALLKEYLYNYNVDDGQNRPNSKSIIEIKKAYYKSVKELTDKMSRKERNVFYIMNNYEIATSMLSNHEITKGIRYLSTCLCYPKTTYYVIKRLKERIISTHFYNYLEKKYST